MLTRVSCWHPLALAPKAGSRFILHHHPPVDRKVDLSCRFSSTDTFVKSDIIITDAPLLAHLVERRGTDSEGERKLRISTNAMNRPVLSLCTFVLALASLIRTAEVADGADLRSTRSDGMVVRQVSYTAESPEATWDAEVSPEPVIESYSFDESPLIEDSYLPEPIDVGEYAPNGPRWCDGYWVEADFLLWWRKGRRFPPLVTRVVPAFPSPTNPAVANSLTTDEAPVVFGGGPIEEHVQPGGRLDFGLWIDARRHFGMGARFAAVGDSPVSFTDSSDGTVVGIGRPFFDTFANLNNALIVAGGDNDPMRTNASSGRISIDTNSEMLAGDVYYRLLLHQNGRMRTDIIFGYQFGRIDENLNVSAFTSNPLIGSWEHRDTFAVENEYHGGHFGLQGDFRYGRWGLEMLAKFAFGNMHQTVQIEGVGEFRDLGGNPFPTSGLLAQASTNAGTHIQDRFSFMEDVKVAIAYWPSSRFKISAGYSLMYWSSVVRPGEHIDYGVDGRILLDPTNPPANAVRPAFSFRPVGFFIHGMNLSMEYRF